MVRPRFHNTHFCHIPYWHRLFVAGLRLLWLYVAAVYLLGPIMQLSQFAPYGWNLPVVGMLLIGWLFILVPIGDGILQGLARGKCQRLIRRGEYRVD